MFRQLLSAQKRLAVSYMLLRHSDSFCLTHAVKQHSIDHALLIHICIQSDWCCHPTIISLNLSNPHPLYSFCNLVEYMSSQFVWDSVFISMHSIIFFRLYVSCQCTSPSLSTKKQLPPDLVFYVLNLELKCVLSSNVIKSVTKIR